MGERSFSRVWYLYLYFKERYEGEWKNDNKDGYGEYYFSSGDVYTMECGKEENELG